TNTTNYFRNDNLHTGCDTLLHSLKSSSQEQYLGTLEQAWPGCLGSVDKTNRVVYDDQNKDSVKIHCYYCRYPSEPNLSTQETSSSNDIGVILSVTNLTIGF